MDKKLILRSFADDVINLLGTSLVKIVLYGSYARGDFHENSDMDVMILTSLNDDGIRKIENSVYDIASDYELSENVHISVSIKNIDHFNYWLGALPYYDNIEKEGIVLVRWKKKALCEYRMQNAQESLSVAEDCYWKIISKIPLTDLITRYFMQQKQSFL